MTFMGAYKHLDNLCRDMNGKGISGYIEDMERDRGASYRVANWEDDYKKLKHYRWVRNQIAHENYADEENMCEIGDTQWLEDFYDRIMNQTDPLALYRKMNAPVCQSSSPREKKNASYSSISNSYELHQYYVSNPGYTSYQDIPSTADTKRRTGKMRKVIACMMLIGAIVFILFAFGHPEFSWPWDNRISYTLYGIYAVIMVILFAIPNKK